MADPRSIADGSVAILKTGDKLPALSHVPGDFEDWIGARMGLRPAQTRVIAVHRGMPLPNLTDVRAVVITGSAAMVTDHSDWIEQSAQWLGYAVALGLPVLGICFGHQLLAYALGGEVGDNSNGVEVGTVAVQLQSAAQTDTLFSGLPETVHVHASHGQSVWKLPPAAYLLASSDRDPHHAFRVGPVAWGVQFHPEFSGAVTAAYAGFYRRRDAGKNISGASRSIQPCYETPYGDRLLRRFARVVAEHGRVDYSRDAS